MLNELTQIDKVTCHQATVSRHLLHLMYQLLFHNAKVTNFNAIPIDCLKMNQNGKFFVGDSPNF